MMTDCEEEEDLSRSQSPMIPLTIESTLIDIKTEPSDEDSKDFADHLTDFNEEEEEDEEDILNSSLTPMDWLPRLNAKAGMVEVGCFDNFPIHCVFGKVLKRQKAFYLRRASAAKYS